MDEDDFLTESQIDEADFLTESQIDEADEDLRIIANEPKHTPGPWFFSPENSPADWKIVMTKGGSIVANVNTETADFGPALPSIKMPANANARLIAAAPELLALAEKIEKYITSLPPAYQDSEAIPRACILSDARAAIAKATEKDWK